MQSEGRQCERGNTRYSIAHAEIQEAYKHQIVPAKKTVKARRMPMTGPMNEYL